MTRCCRFNIWDAICGLQSWLDVTKVGTNYMGAHVEYDGTESERWRYAYDDGDHVSPNVGYFTITLNSDRLIPCVSTT